jgi:predicted TIM-barrel fold metal-dependent hydrolase
LPVPEAADSDMRVDIHAHITPSSFAATLRDEGQLPEFGLPEWSPEKCLETMDRWGTSACVLSLTPPGVYLRDQETASKLARSVNEEIATTVRERPARFGGLAVLPLPDLDAALRELTYALDVLKLDGVELYTNVAGIYLGDPRWDELFDELDRRAALVLVHPLSPPYQEPLEYPSYLIEFPMDTTRAVVNLMYSGTLQRCPNVKFVLSHLGGMVPFLAGRIRSLTLRTSVYDSSVPDGPLTYLRRMYYDTGLAANEPALRASLSLAGPDRIVFGTDWPYAEVSDDASDPQPALRDVLTASEMQRVVAGNAADLVPRLSTISSS